MNRDNTRKHETFNAIEMKRHIQEQIYEDTKGMTPEEFIAYMHWRIEHSQFADFLKKDVSPQPQLNLSVPSE